METPSDTPQTAADAAQPAVIPARDPAEVRAYNQAHRRLNLADIAISLVYWLTWCWLARGFVTGAGLADGSRWVGLVVAGMAMMGGSVLVGLPLGYYGGYTLEHRFKLSNQTFTAWMVYQLKSWLVGGLIGGVVLAGLYAAVWYGGRWWGVWVWIGVMLLSVVLAKVFPLVILPLFYPSKPLERPSLADRLRQLAGGAGMTITGIFNLELSKDTKKANAMLAGMGSSRRVYLSDTLLESFDDDQIAVVFAHELGHHVRGHIWKLIGISAVVSSLLVTLIWWRLNPFAGSSVPADWSRAIAGLAQVMLITTVFPLLIGPITNAISRRFERQCDGDALRLVNNPQAYRTAFEQLGRLNLDDPDPPWWEVVWFDDHPPLRQRIAMADEHA
jgi:STE24 endopeptidase